MGELHLVQYAVKQAYGCVMLRNALKCISDTFCFQGVVALQPSEAQFLFGS